jgi:CheY-like chemotaxis protein
MRRYGTDSCCRRSRFAEARDRPRAVGRAARCRRAPNGNVAIEKLHEGQYDVVLSDLKMGGSDGMDVLRTAKALHRRRP